MTPREIRFLYKAYEDKIVSESYRIYNATYTAFYNANRPKRKRALKLFKKRNEKISNATKQENIVAVLESQKNDGNWVQKLYAANNYNIPSGGVKCGKSNIERKN